MPGPPRPSPHDQIVVNDAIVDYIVGVVKVSPETVIDSIQENKCDDISAMYHMLNHVMQRQLAVMAATSLPTTAPPPLSPTSMTPFFQNTPSQSSNSGSPSPRGPTEVFNNEASLVSHPTISAEEHQRLLNLRRHTLGPGQTPMHDQLALPFPYPQNADFRDILPQTNLTANLALVGNLPPENFSVKDPHLLKPPLALGVTFSQLYGRRASDGGAYFGPGFAVSPAAEAPPSTKYFHSAQAAPPQSSLPDAEGGSQDPLQQQQCLVPNLSDPTFSIQQVEHFIKAGQPPDSPRKRRTGVFTEPPAINPELVQEVETRMSNHQQSPVQSPSPLMSPPSPFSGLSPMTSPSKLCASSAGAGGIRQRRTGLSTVMEVGKTGSSSYKESSSLSLPSERYSPVRRQSDGSPNFLRGPMSPQTSLSSSVDRDPSPSDVRALQEECRKLHIETSSRHHHPPQQSLVMHSANSLASSSYTSSNSSHVGGGTTFLLRPPSADESSANLPRRSSDGVVGQSSKTLLQPSVSTNSANSEPMQQLYNEMYNTDLIPTASTSSNAATSNVSSSRRFSYPNSPVHHPFQDKSGDHGSGKSTLTSGLSGHGLMRISRGASNFGTSSKMLSQQIQSLSIQQRESEGGGSKFKGSITQGVPGRPISRGQSIAHPIELHTAGNNPLLNMAHSKSFDEAFATNDEESIPLNLSSGSNWTKQENISNQNRECKETKPEVPNNDSLIVLHGPAAADPNVIPNPEVCVTNVMGDEIKLTFNQQQQMQQHHLLQQQQQKGQFQSPYHHYYHPSKQILFEMPQPMDESS